ncbi:hypothetical protein PAEPH01_1433 [Pancytospora epiphaga]|nr:hypothetical protein PAEPH01_1433 [Pancytospora epiphaga]
MSGRQDENTRPQMMESIPWKKMPDAPVPGLFCMDMVPNIDTRSHDASLDNEYKLIHTPFLDFFPIDILAEMRNINDTTQETWLRHDEQIDSRYYREQSDRRDCIKRKEAKDYIEDVRDYQQYVNETFTAINKRLPNYEIVAEYELFPDTTTSMVLGNGEATAGESFEGRKGQSTLVDICLVGDQCYECIKQNSPDNIVIEVRDGKAYYTVIPCVYKFKKINKNGGC